MNARIPRTLWHRMRFLCVVEDRSMQDFVNAAMRDYLRSHHHRWGSRDAALEAWGV